MYTFIKRLRLEQDETLLILKRSKAGLNLEFSFSSTGCLTKPKESSMVAENGKIRTFLKGIIEKWNTNKLVSDLNPGH